ncbi:MAG: hypothetical protein ABI766_12295 [Gemmatimonadales bacterium]
MAIGQATLRCHHRRVARHPGDPRARSQEPPSAEASTRTPVPPRLNVPREPRRRLGLLLSLAVHALILGLAIGHGERIWSRTLAPGDPALLMGGGGGGGGNRVAYITLPAVAPSTAARATPVVPPAPIPPKVLPKPIPDPIVTPPEAVASTAPIDTAPAGTGLGPGTGGGAAGGAGTGVGPGTGGGTGSAVGAGGRGGTTRPPELRDLAFPFDTPPKQLRGASLNVTFWVRVDGRVERYEVDPEIADHDYAQKFDEVIRSFRFTPARAPDGTRVAGTTTVTFTLPGKSRS